MISVLERQIIETPLAIVDLETTGLMAGGDKIVEVAVVRAEPGATPQLVLNTLVDPHRPVAATEIHGITDADVAGAPDIMEIAGNIADGVENAVLASYNVYFDIKFLEIEYSKPRGSLPPYVCLMYMRPMLTLEKVFARGRFACVWCRPRRCSPSRGRRIGERQTVASLCRNFIFKRSAHVCGPSKVEGLQVPRKLR